MCHVQRTLKNAFLTLYNNIIPMYGIIIRCMEIGKHYVCRYLRVLRPLLSPKKNDDVMFVSVCVCGNGKRKKKFLGGEIYYVRHPFQLHPIKSKYTPSAVLYVYVYNIIIIFIIYFIASSCLNAFHVVYNN